MTTKKKIIFIFMLLFFQSCIKQPDLDRSSELLGKDSNGDGVRDDIERYIDSLDLKPDEKKAVMNDAKTYQDVLKIEPTDKEQAKKISIPFLNTFQCLIYKLGHDKAGKIHLDLEKYTMNTKERAIHYIKYNASLSGTTSTLKQGNTCEE